ncbi:hypothetical protein HGRIS_011930 [Hohenbuehelia grisea]|uniref:Uncharacterized protein n=1 Tax=Hohenbuehelia grisea TaxID=104357 RepID=A0ABR3JWK1_9AGAR
MATRHRVRVESQVNVNDPVADPQEYLKQVIKATRMRVLLPAIVISRPATRQSDVIACICFILLGSYARSRFIIEQQTVESTIANGILRNLKPRYEAHHSVGASNSALGTAVDQPKLEMAATPDRTMSVNPPTYIKGWAVDNKKLKDLLQLPSDTSVNDPHVWNVVTKLLQHMSNSNSIDLSVGRPLEQTGSEKISYVVVVLEEGDDLETLQRMPMELPEYLKKYNEVMDGPNVYRWIAD